MPGKFRPFGDAEVARITEAVKAAEAKSHGEIVPVVVERCEAYPEAQERGGVAGALLATVALLGIPHALSAWGTVLLHLAAYVVGDSAAWWDPHAVQLWGLVLLQIAGYAVGYTAARWQPLARALIGKKTLARAARWRAELAFREYGLVNTARGTGVLVFAALFERQVVVLGDQPVVEAFGEGEFRHIVERMVERVREGRAAEGFLEAIGTLGDDLAQHFPFSPGAERNELPDHLRT